VLNNLAIKQTEDSYQWSDHSVTDNLTTTNPGIYWLESSNTCGAMRDSISISFKDSCTCFPFYPAVDLGADVEMCHYDSVLLKNLVHQEGYRYHWSTGGQNLQETIKSTGLFWLQVSTYCSTVTDTILIKNKIDGCERNVFIPSAFTPNDDGKNDLFKPTVFGTPEKYEFTVYNRWGQLVFNTKNTQMGWNGRIKGSKQNSNLFIWTCSYKFSGEQAVFNRGSVVLIR
jgi:gliding motility-associated-like protein